MTALETQLRNSVALLGGDVKTKEVPVSDQLAVVTDTGPMGSRQLFAIQTFEDCWRVSKLLSSTDFVPFAYRGKPEMAFAAIMMGHELGLGPLQAMQGIAVINNRPSVWGDLALALAQRHRDFVDCIETFDARTFTATCTVKRRGKSDKTATFSLDMAKRAGLTNKRDTPWQTYPERMCQMRARSWAMRDQFSDALRGLSIAEEVNDFVNGTSVVVPSEYLPPPSAPAAPVYTATSPVETVERVERATLQSVPPPPPQAATMEQVVVLDDPEDFRIKSGKKNAGKRLGDLNFDQLRWYGHDCLDLPTKHNAKLVFDKRYPNGRPDEYVDGDGVVHSANNNAGEAAQ